MLGVPTLAGVPPSPPRCGQTDTCENNTFPNPSSAGGNNKKLSNFQVIMTKGDKIGSNFYGGKSNVETAINLYDVSITVILLTLRFILESTGGSVSSM